MSNRNIPTELFQLFYRTSQKVVQDLESFSMGAIVSCGLYPGKEFTRSYQDE